MEAISVPKGFKITPKQFEQLASAEQTARMELSDSPDSHRKRPKGLASRHRLLASPNPVKE